MLSGDAPVRKGGREAVQGENETHNEDAAEASVNPTGYSLEESQIEAKACVLSVPLASSLGLPQARQFSCEGGGEI